MATSVAACRGNGGIEDSATPAFSVASAGITLRFSVGWVDELQLSFRDKRRRQLPDAFVFHHDDGTCILYGRKHFIAIDSDCQFGDITVKRNVDNFAGNQHPHGIDLGALLLAPMRFEEFTALQLFQFRIEYKTARRVIQIGTNDFLLALGTTQREEDRHGQQAKASPQFRNLDDVSFLRRLISPMPIDLDAILVRSSV